MHFHLPASPSPLLSLTAFLSDCPFGLVYCFQPPTHRLRVPHDIPLPSVMLSSVSLLPLHPSNIPHCCSAFPCLLPLLLDFKSGGSCSLFTLLLPNLYSADFHYLLFVISFCVYIMNALCPCKMMMSSTCLD